MNQNAQSAEDGISQGSYEFNGSDANAVSWINCVTRNMFSKTSDGSLQAYPVYRGLFGTNRIRNMYLKDCYLNSFDAHTGANNVTIEDSTFEHMNFVGGGKITLKNVVIYTSNQGTVVNLREDYGSIWKGDLDIDGLEVRYCSEAGSYKPARISLIKGNYQNQYFGFDDGLYMPENVTINNFHIRAYSATVSNGVRDERLGALHDSGMSVYYYNGTADRSYGIEAGDMHNLKSSEVATTTAPGANLPTDKATTGNGTSVLNGTKNLTITNSVSITLPTGNFWINMNVTKDGTVYALEEKKILGIGLGSYEWKAQ